MKYIVRTLMMLLYIPGSIIVVFGFILSFILTIIQTPIWFILKGEFIEDDDTILIWYIEHVIGWAGDLWEKMLKWSRE